MFHIKTLNNISARGLSQFSDARYQIGTDIVNPDAILLRSYNMHQFELPTSVQVIGRAGAGTNNIPVAQLTELGIPVLNTPGANANAVKELVIAGMLLASRNICEAWYYVRQLQMDNAAQLNQHIEAHKKQFVGSELPGKVLGIIGLGNIGVQVANAAYELGMRVIGYDAAITVKNAWQLSAYVEQAEHIDQVLKQSDFVSVHVPLLESTRHLLNADKLSLMHQDAVLLNFAREEIVDNEGLMQTLAAQRLRYYVCDFPDPIFKNHPRVISLPHLGASTYEAEENCAMMIAQQVQAYLEDGHIINAVNFPEVKMARGQGQCYRLAIFNANVPNMVAQISMVLSQSNINIIDMINKSKGNMAYTLLDVDTAMTEQVLAAINAIQGVVRARCIPCRE